jgi:hypothetical protein
MCQKAGGNFGMAYFGAPDLTFSRGTPAAFESSPGVMRGFCARCGTPLFMRVGDGPYDMTVGSLDLPDALPPMKSQIGIESRTRWFRELPNVPAHPTSAAYDGREPGAGRSFQHPDHDTAIWPEEHT